MTTTENHIDIVAATRGSVWITHTYTEGTLLRGTSRGDGTAEVVKANGWRWGRSIGMWYLPNSRDRLSNDWKIATTIRALHAAGFTDATSEVDNTPASTAEVEAAKAERAEQRADGLAAKADRREGEAAAAWDREQTLHDMLPPGGEPIKIGHHSEHRHRRAIDKSWQALGRAITAEDEAKAARRAAEIAADATDHRNAPVTVANRIERLRADLRRHQRHLAGHVEYVDGKLVTIPPGEAYAARLTQMIAIAEDQIGYWEDVRAAQQATGLATSFSKANVAKGGRVRHRGTWYPVIRANAKSVTITALIGLGKPMSWTDTIPYAEVQAYEPPEEQP